MGVDSFGWFTVLERRVFDVLHVKFESNKTLHHMTPCLGILFCLAAASIIMEV